MRISNIRRAGATAYRHLHEGLRTASAVVEKRAHVYSLVQPLLQHASFDTTDVDAALMGAYSRYQAARHLAVKIDGVIN